MAILILGLGNPGKKFKNTPHNLGFEVVDAFHKKYNFPDWKKNYKALALISEKTIEKKKIFLAKPQTFMNKSGYAAKSLSKLLNISKHNIWVVHDDADLPLGKLKISQKRGSAGHKGVNSILKTLQTKDLVRFRLGTKLEKEQSGKRDLSRLVLKPFNKGQKSKIIKVVDLATQALECAILHGIARCMSEYNKK